MLLIFEKIYARFFFFFPSSILVYTDNVILEFKGSDSVGMTNGSKGGRIYLTTHRLIFINNTSKDSLQSFSFPFVTLSEVRFSSLFYYSEIQFTSLSNLTGSSNIFI